jgi:hypothetical protein
MVQSGRSELKDSISNRSAKVNLWYLVIAQLSVALLRRPVTAIRHTAYTKRLSRLFSAGGSPGKHHQAKSLRTSNSLEF